MRCVRLAGEKRRRETMQALSLTNGVVLLADKHPREHALPLMNYQQ
jgi:hypothetical protein